MDFSEFLNKQPLHNKNTGNLFYKCPYLNECFCLFVTSVYEMSVIIIDGNDLFLDRYLKMESLTLINLLRVSFP